MNDNYSNNISINLKGNNIKGSTNNNIIKENYNIYQNISNNLNHINNNENKEKKQKYNFNFSKIIKQAKNLKTI